MAIFIKGALHTVPAAPLFNSANIIRCVKQPLHVSLSAAFSDAGDTIRAVAIAKAIEHTAPPNYALRINFLSCGGRFEHQITGAGFNITPIEPRVKGISVAEDLGWEFPEFFGSKELAESFIRGHMDALNNSKPDVVVHGMWAPVSIAARQLEIPTVNFLPIPLDPVSFTNGLITDIPDRVPLLTNLPRPVRSRIAQWSPALLMRAPIFRQHRLGAAARECGWPVDGPISLFDMNRADLNLVNDLPGFYQHFAHLLPEGIKITGPIYSHQEVPLDEDVSRHIKQKPNRTILVAMGSSGTKEWIFEAIKALTLDESDDWNAVILAPPSACSLDEALALGKNDSRLLITDRFISTVTASQYANVIVTHGGQGTVQTALAGNTPLVGVALQLEQQINLDHVMNVGAGIRIQGQRWRAAHIREAVKTVLGNPNYARNARKLGEMIRGTDGAAGAAAEFWKFIRSIDNRPSKTCWTLEVPPAKPGIWGYVKRLATR